MKAGNHTSKRFSPALATLIAPSLAIPPPAGQGRLAKDTRSLRASSGARSTMRSPLVAAPSPRCKRRGGATIRASRARGLAMRLSPSACASSARRVAPQRRAPRVPLLGAARAGEAGECSASCRRRPLWARRAYARVAAHAPAFTLSLQSPFGEPVVWGVRRRQADGRRR